jgi:hypothetical protein
VAGVGNPYGSYVSQSPADYDPLSVTPRDASYPGGFPSSSQPLPAPVSADWQSHPAAFGDRPAATPGLPPGNGSYPSANAYPAAGIGGQFAAASHPDPAGYQQHAYRAEQYDQRGYASPDISQGVESYGYPGYGSPAR